MYTVAMSSLDIPNFEIAQVDPNDVARYLDEGKLDLHPEVINVLDENLRDGAARLYVALADEIPAGQIALKMTGPNNEDVCAALELEPDEVAPQTGFLQVPGQFRGKGIATALVRRVCDDVADLDFRTIFGKYAAANTPMERLFTHLGYSFTDLEWLLPDHQRNAQGEYDEPALVNMRIVYKRLGQSATAS